MDANLSFPRNFGGRLPYWILIVRDAVHGIRGKVHLKLQ
jgi:hypothetical protein